jgi:cytoskeleton protein RodZ
MPEIGETLRDARMRARIDISEIEAETKIRAKYLRALENEEWDLLPGPTYVKSFLRTYADALGLDAKLLIEEYKLRHEHLSEVELQPIVPRGPGRDRRRQPRAIPRGYVVWGVLLAIAAALLLVGSIGGGGGGGGGGGHPQRANTVASTPTAPSVATHRRAATPAPAPASRLVRLQIVPTGLVWVCLEAAGRRRLVNAQELKPGPRQPVYRSSAFRITLGNNNAQLRVNGRVLTVPDVSSGIGYKITRAGRRVLTPTSRPKCQ